MKRILVIEDNTEVRENIAEILELSDYEVDTAENGKIGVERALANPPDLILCDVMMPELDGFGVLYILEKNPATATIPFVFLTAKSEKSDFRKGMNLGADDYITKPFDDVELLDAIEMRLKKSARIPKAVSPMRTLIDESRGQQELENLSAKGENRILQKKEYLFREGDRPRWLYHVQSGRIKVGLTNEIGKEYITQIYSEGDFIGESNLLKELPYPESAIALEDSQVRLIPKKDFLDILHSNPDLSSRLLQLMADDVLSKEQQLLSLAYNSIRKRVAEALVKLQEQSNTGTFSMQREDLAAMVGTAKESVIRTLSDFKKEGLVEIKGSQIRVVDLKKLEDMPN